MRGMSGVKLAGSLQGEGRWGCGRMNTKVAATSTELWIGCGGNKKLDRNLKLEGASILRGKEVTCDCH